MGSICKNDILLVSQWLYWQGRMTHGCYRLVLYHMPARQDAAAAKADLAKREEELVKLKSKHNIGDDD